MAVFSDTIVLILALLTVSSWICVQGYPTGAPSGACVSMEPTHGVNASTNTNPYSLNITVNMTEQMGNTTTVKVMVIGGDYKGLLLQARLNDSSDTTPVGMWMSPPMDTKLVTCTNANDSVTHSSNTSKNETNMYTWTTPENFTGSVKFIATIVQEKVIYWTNTMSEVMMFEEGEMEDDEDDEDDDSESSTASDTSTTPMSTDNSTSSTESSESSSTETDSSTSTNDDNSTTTEAATSSTTEASSSTSTEASNSTTMEDSSSTTMEDSSSTSTEASNSTTTEASSSTSTEPSGSTTMEASSSTTMEASSSSTGEDSSSTSTEPTNSTSTEASSSTTTPASGSTTTASQESTAANGNTGTESSTQASTTDAVVSSTAGTSNGNAESSTAPQGGTTTTAQAGSSTTTSISSTANSNSNNAPTTVTASNTGQSNTTTTTTAAPTTTTTAAPPEVRQQEVKTVAKVAGTFTEDLANTSSPKYQSMADDVKAMADAVYNRTESNINNAVYKGIKDVSFSSGSIVVEYAVILEIQIFANTDVVALAETLKTQTATALVEAVNEGLPGIPNTLAVNVTSITTETVVACQEGKMEYYVNDVRTCVDESAGVTSQASLLFIILTALLPFWLH